MYAVEAHRAHLLDQERCNRRVTIEGGEVDGVEPIATGNRKALPEVRPADNGKGHVCHVKIWAG